MDGEYRARLYWFEDLEIGAQGRSASRTITEHDVGTFAGLTGDNAELHTSETYAAESIFGGRIAHGMLNLVIAHGLMVRAGYLDGTGVALLGWNNTRFVAPVPIGTTVRAEWETIALRGSTSRPDVGIVTDRVVLKRADGVVAMTGEVTEMVRRRPF
ncbi:MaoC family dehydratase [Mesobacterium pallidum]|uniref:MaoC family dehydratase n=1 Tax=Mesobacterium pallidum TaxID=2872037 RepID=UPI001EE30864|nr:MaoC/PaaZ C-terminal domain-containing protein [Mesobacterium pallidum]